MTKPDVDVVIVVFFVVVVVVGVVVAFAAMAVVVVVVVVGGSGGSVSAAAAAATTAEVAQVAAEVVAVVGVVTVLIAVVSSCPMTCHRAESSRNQLWYQPPGCLSLTTAQSGCDCRRTGHTSAFSNWSLRVGRGEDGICVLVS